MPCVHFEKDQKVWTLRRRGKVIYHYFLGKCTVQNL